MKIINTVRTASAIGILSFFTSACIPEDPGATSDKGDLVNPVATAPEGRAMIARSIESAACELSELQIEMLELVNEARSEGRYCGDDFFEPAGAVTWNCKLADAAMVHNEDMVKNNFFAHEGSNGLKAGSRIDGVGYKWRSYGENLAAGFIEPKDAMQALLDSPGHCVNIMGRQFAEFGAASMFYTDAEYHHYWTQIYGTEL